MSVHDFEVIARYRLNFQIRCQVCPDCRGVIWEFCAYLRPHKMNFARIIARPVMLQRKMSTIAHPHNFWCKPHVERKLTATALAAVSRDMRQSFSRMQNVGKGFTRPQVYQGG